MNGQESEVLILLVEDNPGDVRLTREALAESKLRNRLVVASDGAQALAYLRREPPNAAEPRPGLILLDLNLPGLSGLEVLAAIKSDPELRRIPVIVLTSSEAEQDIARSYDLQANCCISKPVDLDRFAQVVRTVEGFWMRIVRLPEEAE